jgi:hypothetical protein
MTRTWSSGREHAESCNPAGRDISSRTIGLLRGLSLPPYKTMTEQRSLPTGPTCQRSAAVPDWSRRMWLVHNCWSVASRQSGGAVLDEEPPPACLATNVQLRSKCAVAHKRRGMEMQTTKMLLSPLHSLPSYFLYYLLSALLSIFISPPPLWWLGALSYPSPAHPRHTSSRSCEAAAWPACLRTESRIACAPRVFS